MEIGKKIVFSRELGSEIGEGIMGFWRGRRGIIVGDFSKKRKVDKRRLLRDETLSVMKKGK